MKIVDDVTIKHETTLFSHSLMSELSVLSQASSRLQKRLPEDGHRVGQMEKVRMRLDEIPNSQDPVHSLKLGSVPNFPHGYFHAG